MKTVLSKVAPVANKMEADDGFGDFMQGPSVPGAGLPGSAVNQNKPPADQQETTGNNVDLQATTQVLAPKTKGIT